MRTNHRNHRKRDSLHHLFAEYNYVILNTQERMYKNCQRYLRDFNEFKKIDFFSIRQSSDSRFNSREIIFAYFISRRIKQVVFNELWQIIVFLNSCDIITMRPYYIVEDKTTSKISLEIIDIVEITQYLRCNSAISIGTQTLISKIYRRLNTDMFFVAVAAPDTPAITHPGDFNEIGYDLTL